LIKGFTTTATAPTATSNDDGDEEWRKRLQQWSTMKSIAAGSSLVTPLDQASALCDVGFAYHQGTVPTETPQTTLPADSSKAKALYAQSAALDYAPAASLLADYYFYNKNTDTQNTDTDDRNTAAVDKQQQQQQQQHRDEQATRWCYTTLDLTDAALPGDAYLRSRASQKLGILNFRENNEIYTPHAQSHFEDALESCQQHLGGNWPFLLSHDPPGLFLLLQKESEELDNVPLLQTNLSGFQTSSALEWKNGTSVESMVALRSYTLQMRDIETKDTEFALSLQKDSLELFSSTVEGSTWGVTYLSSFFQVMGNPLIQQSMNSNNNPTNNKKKKKNYQMVVLGSALGSACVWPATAFGFQAVGFDIMDTCIDTSNRLIESVAGKGGELLRERVEFRKIDVLQEIEEVQTAINNNTNCGNDDDDDETMNIIWSNDYMWGEEAQLEVENKAFEAMRTGDVIVLYRHPHTLQINKWSRGGKIENVAVSWDVHSTMYVLIK